MPVDIRSSGVQEGGIVIEQSDGGITFLAQQPAEAFLTRALLRTTCVVMVDMPRANAARFIAAAYGAFSILRRQEGVVLFYGQAMPGRKMPCAILLTLFIGVLLPPVPGIIANACGIVALILGDACLALRLLAVLGRPVRL